MKQQTYNCNRGSRRELVVEVAGKNGEAGEVHRPAFVGVAVLVIDAGPARVN
jgi:hypothetical protein